ncbi:MAG: hypothetical protein KDK48_05185, partial [Chlamydiia bacterium]|nr:hypothetical protein [Chlamydiia bacterium]
MIQFTNPLHFLSHFSTNSALSLQPGQDLRIDEVGNLWESETLSGVQEPPSSAKNRALFTLNKIMHLAGKTLKFEGGGEIEFTCKDSLTLSGSGRLTLIAEYGDIVTRLSDLFRMMLVHSVRAISLQPRQRLIVYDLHNDETPELFPRTYIARAPSGTLPQISGMGEIKERKVDYFGLRLTRSMTIEPQPALRLELHGFNLFPGETHFVNRMRIRDDLPLPSGCSLTITSKELKETWAEYRKSLPPLEALQAALSSPFLIEGQQIVLSSNASLSLKTMSEGIHVLSTGTTTFYRREAQQLTTHGADLYRALLSARETSYRVPTHNGLKLVGIGAEESVSDFFRRTAPAGLDVAVFGERPIQRGEGWALLPPSVPLHIEIAPSSPANVLHRLIAKYGLNLETKGQRAFLLNHFFYETLTGHARKLALFHPELLRTLKAKTLEKILGI